MRGDTRLLGQLGHPFDDGQSEQTEDLGGLKHERA